MRFADLNASGRTFVEELRAYEEWLRGMCPGVEWHGVVVRLNDSESPLAPDDVEPRAGEILATAMHGWVNLTAETVEDGVLVAAVEWFRDGPGRAAPVSVNWSGFDRGELERLRR